MDMCEALMCFVGLIKYAYNIPRNFANITTNMLLKVLKKVRKNEGKKSGKVRKKSGFFGSLDPYEPCTLATPGGATLASICLTLFLV